MNRGLFALLALSLAAPLPALAQSAGAPQVASQVQRAQTRQIEDAIHRSLEQRRAQTSRRQDQESPPRPAIPASPTEEKR